MCDGCCAVDVPPSPKVHDQAVGDPVELSVKATVSGAMPAVGDPLKSATGGCGAGEGEGDGDGDGEGDGGAPPNAS